MKATVTIISMHSRAYRPAPALPPQYTVEVERRDEAIITLDKAWELTNREDRPRAKEFCSTSAGDLMILDGQYYLVEGGSYHPLTPAEAEAAMKLTTRDTSWGYDDLKKHNLI